MKSLYDPLRTIVESELSAKRKLSRNGLVGDQFVISSKPTSGPEQLPHCLSPRPQARASKRGNSFEFRQADIPALIGRKLAYIVLLYCLASHPIQFERRSVILGLLLTLGQMLTLEMLADRQSPQFWPT
jgi:hypothetical protein